MRRLVTAILVALCAPALLTAQLKTPADWKWRQDTQALARPMAERGPSCRCLRAGTSRPDQACSSTRRATAKSTATTRWKRRFSSSPVKAPRNTACFSAAATSTSSAAPEYVAFVLRRDGHAAILRQGGGSPTAVSAWQRHAAILAGKPADNVKNVLRVDVDPVNATLSVNGEKVVSVPRAGIGGDGRIGFRIGKDMNLHISSLNVTRRLAPVPVKKD